MPCGDNSLRDSVQTRMSIKIGRFDNLPPKMEFMLVELLVNEINFQRRVEALKAEIN